MNLEIKEGRSYFLKNGSVALVTGRSQDNMVWLVNMVDSHGKIIKDVEVLDENFEKRIGFSVAKTTAMDILEKKFNQLFSK